MATIPQRLSEFLAAESLDMAAVDTGQRLPASRAEILAAFDESQAAARAYLTSLDEERAAETWTLVAGGKDLVSLPRAVAIRSFLFNHLYHHRGQVLVYLRLLDVPVPSVYGPTADENPFAGAM